MNYTRRILTFIFAVLLLAGTAAVAASAQSRGGRRYHRPVRVYYIQRDPFWSWNYWNHPYYDPYYSERQQRYYMENRLRGNRRELAEHLEKYNADGVITAKERRELEDDYKDVNRARANLNRYYRNY